MKYLGLLGLNFLFTLGAFAMPPAKRTKKMKQALIIVDVQNDYFQGGKMELVGTEQAADHVQQILAESRKKKVPVIHVQHIATDPAATFFLPDSKGVEINDRVKPLPAEKLIIKHYPNSFRETELLKYLKDNGITHLTIVGMMTHVCIDATVKAAKDFGFECTVIADACATRDLEVKGAKVSAENVQTALIGALGFYYSTIMTTKEFLNQNK